MNIIASVILILLPLVLLLKKENSLIKTLGPVIICYGVGILFGNMFEISESVPKLASEAAIPLAIPLLLVSCDFMKWFKNSNKTLLSFCFVLLSVLLVSSMVSYFYAPYLPEYKKLAAMMVGVYTGGTPNMSAIGLALKVKSETFVLLNTADVILGGLYLLFIFTIGKPFFAKILKVEKKNDDGKNYKKDNVLCFWTKVKNISLFFILSALTTGLSLALSSLLFNAENVGFIILFISFIGVIFSFIPRVSSMFGSYELGEYFLLIFCIAVGMMAKIENIYNASSLLLSYAACIMFGSIIIHTLLCKIFKIDRDTAIITSVAGIFGPPFVAPVAEALQNRQLIVAGVSSGLIGYALGNFLGLGLYYFYN